MSLITPIPPETPFLKRMILKVPVLGWIARDVLYGSRDNLLYAAIIVATLWILSVVTWGVWALLVPFVLAVPAAIAGIFAILVWRHDRRTARAAADDQPSS